MFWSFPMDADSIIREHLTTSSVFSGIINNARFVTSHICKAYGSLVSDFGNSWLLQKFKPETFNQMSIMLQACILKVVSQFQSFDSDAELSFHTRSIHVPDSFKKYECHCGQKFVLKMDLKDHTTSCKPE